VNSSFYCVKLFGLTLSGDSYNCSQSNNVVYTNNLMYPSTDTTVFIWLLIYGVKNPENTKESSYFTFKTYDAVGNVVCIN